MKLSLRKVLPLLLLVSGFLLLASVFFPIGFDSLAVFISSGPSLLDPTAVSSYPVPIVVNILGTSSLDYTQASSWFDQTSSFPVPENSPVTYFSLSIPRLKMQDIAVEVNGTDLKKNAIHYPGTALPGEYGNSVIFGHSALPQFYRPGHVMTIFNPLVKAKIGDEVIINFDGVTYHYFIRKTTVVDASAVSVLAQVYDRRELTLITCTPLGTYWYRFVAIAELEK
jgi:sortase A